MTPGDLSLAYGSVEFASTSAYKLVELPPDLVKLIEAQDSEPVSISIKGNPAEDATLHTLSKTYAIRAVSLSNTMAVATGRVPGVPEEEGADVVIRDELHEIYELVLTVPKLEKLKGMLRGLEYDEGREELGESGEDEDELDERPRKRRRVTYDTALSQIQASPHELASALASRRILVLPTTLRPFAPAYLSAVLTHLLNDLIALGLDHTDAPVEQLVKALEESAELGRSAGRQVIVWFGSVTEKEGKEKWAMDVNAVLREVGVGLLRNHRNEPIDEDNFLALWRAAVGDAFEANVDMALLSGTYLTHIIPPSSFPSLTYFPASELPPAPAERFADLFATRARWRGAEIAPFLDDIAVDKKDRDRLLLKFARTTTDGEVWYTARSK